MQLKRNVYSIEKKSISTHHHQGYPHQNIEAWNWDGPIFVVQRGVGKEEYYGRAYYLIQILMQFSQAPVIVALYHRSLPLKLPVTSCGRRGWNCKSVIVLSQKRVVLSSPHDLLEIHENRLRKDLCNKNRHVLNHLPSRFELKAIYGFQKGNVFYFEVQYTFDKMTMKDVACNVMMKMPLMSSN